MTDQERQAFQDRIRGKATSIMEQVEEPLRQVRQVVEESTRNNNTFSASDIDNFGETYYSEPVEETIVDNSEYISQDQYIREQYRQPINEDYTPREYTTEDLLNEVDENAKIAEETDDELRAKLRAKGFPETVVEAYVNTRVVAVDPQLIKEAITGNLTVNEIRARYGGKLMDEAINGGKPAPAPAPQKQTNQTSVPRPKVITEAVIPQQQKSVITEDIRKVIREEIQASNQSNQVLIRMGDTIRFVVGDDIYEIPEIKFVGKKKKK